MRRILVIGALASVCAGCTTPVVTQTAATPGGAGTLNDQVVCRTIVGQAEIDGTPQRIVGNACRQPDGSWQIDTDEAVLYPAYPYYDPWYDPWLVWPGATIGIGGSFVFFDHFHHFHHHDHPGSGGHGPWHGRAGTHVAGTMHGGGGMFMNTGGGMRR